MGGMLKRYAGACLLLQAALLAGCGEGSAPAPQARQAAPAAKVAPAGPERLVIAFGDSLYAGYGLQPSESLPAELQDRLREGGINARVVNAGVSGDTTAAGRQRLAFVLDAQPRKPDLVVLGLGGNDVLRQLPPAETRANLDAMLAELRRRDIPVVLTGMVAPRNLGPDYVAAFERIYPELAAEYDARLHPFILEGVIQDRSLMLPDGIHPNDRGVDRIVDGLQGAVAAQLRAMPGARA